MKSHDVLLPPDESYQRINLGNRTVILSVSDSPVAIGPGTPLGDDFTGKTEVAIFAESIVISGRVRARKLGLFAHDINVRSGAALDVGGTDGADGLSVSKGDGSDGGNGAKAGAIDAYVEILSSQAGKLGWWAAGGNGGAGQATQDGKGGKGGDGGEGGAVRVWFSNACQAIVGRLDAIFDISGSSATDTLKKKRDAAMALLPSLKSVAVGHDVLLATIARLEAVSGMTTTTTAELEKALDSVDMSLRAESDIDRNALLTGSNVAGGRYGVAGPGTTGSGGSGTVGAAGKSVVTGFFFESQAMRSIPFVFAHPDQCQMLLQKAGALYYAGSLDSIRDAVTLLQRLLSRLAFVPTLVPTDPLGIAYLASESRLFMSLRSAVHLRSIYDTASTMMRQINLGQDYYGRGYRYTPRGSYRFYDQQTARLIVNLGEIEKAHAAYFAAQADQKATIDMVSIARASSDALVAEATDAIGLLKTDATSTAHTIAAFEPVIKAKRASVYALIEKVKEEVDRIITFNFHDIVEALTMCAFAPNKWMAGLQLTNLAFKAKTQIPDDTGDDVNKDYLCNAISDCEASSDALIHAYERRDDGTLTVADPGASKLLVQRDDLFKLLSKYRTQLSADTLTTLRTGFDDYINTVLERNSAIVHYNAIVALWLKYQNQNAYYAAKKAELGDSALATIDLNLPLVASYVARLYRDGRSQALEMLYLTQRALRFWSLTSKDAIGQALDNAPLSDVNLTAITKIQSNLIRQFSSAIESFGRSAQHFPARGDDPGVIVKLAPEEVDTLKANRGVIVRIPPVYPNTPKSESPFAGWANVRLSRVRAWVKGAKTKDGELQVRIRHFGRETIVDSSGLDFQFEHDPVDVIFRYLIGTNVLLEDGDISQNEDQTYALLGPFASWKIYVSNSDNSQLDLTQVTEVWLEFFGTNYSFATSFRAFDS